MTKIPVKKAPPVEFDVPIHEGDDAPPLPDFLEQIFLPKERIPRTPVPPPE